jgi:F-type H+-transporting ATPase subunit gamma
MSNIRNIVKRRSAAGNIAKVTGTMETISAVRYRQYFNQWQQGRAFYEALAQFAYLMVSAEQAVAHPLLRESHSNTQVVLVIGSDRGLCGAYNNDLFRLIDTHAKMAKRFGREIQFYAKGQKVVNYMEQRGIRPVHVYTEFAEIPTVEQTKEIADGFIEQYLSGQIGRLGVVYNRFFSAASQKAQTLTILPVFDLIDDLTTRATVIWPWELDFEDFMLVPSATEIFEGLSQMIIRSSILNCFMEAAVSEHLSRVVCMRNASDNAEEMIKELSKEYNRARQGQITVELLDIVSGVEAMK